MFLMAGEQCGYLLSLRLYKLKERKIMFSGIVEEAGVVKSLVKEGDNLHITVKCSFVNELKIDQSVAHNGVCLTVVKLGDDSYTVTAIKETLMRSNLGALKEGDLVNLERSMCMNGRLDGHIVQGHVDTTAVCTSASEKRQPRLHIQVRRADGAQAQGLHHCGQGQRDGQRRVADGLRAYRRHIFGGDNSIHIREHQLLPHKGGHTREPRVRHHRQVR